MAAPRRPGGPPARRKERGHDEPVSPSRTLFVRNVSFNVTEDELRVVFSRFGDIKRIFSLIEKRGMAFVTFYDIRAAEAAREATLQLNLKGRAVFVEYDTRDSTDTGALFVQFRDLRQLPPNDELVRFFSQYGPVAGVHPSEHPMERLVEYYDTRDAERAYEQTGRAPFMGGSLESFRAPSLKKPPAPERARPRSPPSRPRSRSPSPRRAPGHDEGRAYRRHSPPRGGPPPSYAHTQYAPAPVAPPPAPPAASNVSAALLSLLLQPQAPPAAYKPAPAAAALAPLDAQGLGALLSQLTRAAQPPAAPTQQQAGGGDALAQLLRQLQGQGPNPGPGQGRQ